MSKCHLLLSAAGSLVIAACGHDKTYVVEAPSPPAVVETQTVIERQPTESVVEVRLAPEQTRVVREYFVERGCPAGLIQQGGVCVAPGHVTQRVIVGEPLPTDVVIVDLPSDLATRLPTLPADYEYRIVDGDLAIVQSSTRVVVDLGDLD
jgi:hypothetical protein